MTKFMHSGCKWVAPIRLVLLIVALGLSSCTASQSGSQSAWESALYREHSLVGKIWSSADGQFIGESELLARLGQAKYVLLGEKHDNPDHHRLQLRVLDGLLEQRALSSLAFEMLNRDTQDRLDAIQSQTFVNREELKRYLQWDDQGWDWAFYGPLIEAGYNAKLQLLAANIDDSTMRQVYGGELDADIVAAVDSVVMDKLNIDIDESHCGMLPESQFPAMVRVQQSRDDSMAATLVAGAAEAGGTGVQVLIAGNYHARKDLGVANYLHRLQPGLTDEDIISLSFSEVSPDNFAPEDYLQQFTDRRAYDYIWFTPAVSDEDYCASLRNND